MTLKVYTGKPGRKFKRDKKVETKLNRRARLWQRKRSPASIALGFYTRAMDATLPQSERLRAFEFYLKHRARQEIEERRQ